jgi:DNA-directed RNA polymerase subunit RPC12/RpoP
MNDWLNKFFAVFTMYKSQRAADELREEMSLSDEIMCPECGETFGIDGLGDEAGFCPGCGAKLP